MQFPDPRMLVNFGLSAVFFGLLGCPAQDAGPKGPSTKEQPDNKTPSLKTSGTEKKLVIYCGRKEKLVGPVIAAFQEKHPELNVQVKYAGTAQLAAALMEEGGMSPADVFLAQDASTLAVLEAKGLFEQLPADLTAKIGKEYRSKGGKWLGIAARSRVLAYNKEKLAPADLPKDLAELTKAKWKGRVGWAPENASFQSFVAAMLQLRGPEKTKSWLKAMQANAPKGFPSNTPAVMAISRGEIDVALTNHYYLYRLKKEYGDTFPVANHFFNQGDAASMVNVAGAGILKTSNHPMAANAFVGYLVSQEGQAQFAKQNHEFPLASGVESPPGLPTIQDLKTPDIDLAGLDDLKQTIAILRETGTLP